MTTYLSRTAFYTCNWCLESVEESMMTEQADGERICLYCLCSSHGNLKAHISPEQLAKVEARFNALKGV